MLRDKHRDYLSILTPLPTSFSSSSFSSLLRISLLTQRSLPPSKMPHPIAELAAFRAHRSPSPSRKREEDPPSERIERRVERMETFGFGERRAEGLERTGMGEDCRRVLIMSKGWVKRVARVPAIRPGVIRSHAEGAEGVGKGIQRG